MSRRIKDPFAWIEASDERRVNPYRELIGARNPETWVSSKFNFKDPNVWLENVEEEGCTVGACKSAMDKSFTALKIANDGRSKAGQDTVEDLQIRINRIQRNLGLKPFRFKELQDMGYYDELAEDEVRQSLGSQNDDNEFITSTSDLDAQLRREEIMEEIEAESD